MKPSLVVGVCAGMVTTQGAGGFLQTVHKTFAAHGDMAPQTIPTGQYFVMGDNRDVSDDSRYWDDLPRYDIIGQAVVCYWLPSRYQVLR